MSFRVGFASDGALEECCSNEARREGATTLWVVDTLLGEGRSTVGKGGGGVANWKVGAVAASCCCV